MFNKLLSPPAATAAAVLDVPNVDGADAPQLRRARPRHRSSDLPAPDSPKSPLAPQAFERQITWDSLDELVLDPETVRKGRDVWEAFCSGADSREAAGEAIFSVLFETTPSMQGLFTAPQALLALKFIDELDQLVMNLDNPAQLKILVETLGLRHLSIDVTVGHVVLFREALIELFEIELQDGFQTEARDCWEALMNYVGGALLYVKGSHADRLNMLLESWNKANHRTPDKLGKQGSGSSSDLDEAKHGSRHGSHEKAAHDKAHAGRKDKPRTRTAPKTYREMFEFNAAVMGFSHNAWLRDILDSFDTIVTNVANFGRLQEECNILILRIHKSAQGGSVNLSEYKSCMFASLRSLLPSDWNSSYESVWNWLWDNVERMIKQNLGNPPRWEKAMADFAENLDEERAYKMREDIYVKFFALAPAGQEYFKQTNTRLHYIIQQIMQMVYDIINDPKRMVDDISALGLRHVGYGIPTHLFAPFVSAFLDVLHTVAEDKLTLDAYRWSLDLISAMLVRVITEGSTIVMKAVNENSVKNLRKAMCYAPRGSRAQCLLKVQVGTQSISPLSWALESGSFDAAKAIIEDLLTIRADRERYYYGVDSLFERHPDIIQRLCQDCPLLLPTLLDGLVWRSRQTSGDLRRVNYYVKHLLVDDTGSCSRALHWFVHAKDPKIMAHPVITVLSDTLWSSVVLRQFIYSKLWFVCRLLVLMLSQAILPKLSTSEELHVRVMIFAGRLVNYLLTMLYLLVVHARLISSSIREGRVRRICCVPLPSYLFQPAEAGSFFLLVCLLLMCTHEPMFWCLASSEDGGPTDSCDAARDGASFRYSVFCMFALGLHWLLLMDLSVFSTGLSVFVLVCVQVMSEITRFLVSLIFLLLTFGSAISVLEHDYFEMRDIPNTAVALFAITLRMFEDDYRNLQMEPALLAAVFLFVTVSAILLLNLLIAQLNCSYVYIYQDMVGFAKLKRAAVIVETLDSCPRATWDKFVQSLELDKPLEFNEGDIGPPGGIQILERASEHVSVAENIFRFGGLCSEDMQWPDDTNGQEEEDKYDRLERMVQKTLRRLAKKGKAGRSGQSRSNTARSASSLARSSVIE